MRFCWLLFFLLSGNALFGQFGISVKQQNNSFSGWDNLLGQVSSEAASIFDGNLEFGINYWLRLKNQRIEFLPEITYANRVKDHTALGLNLGEAKMQSYGLQINTQIYPLDFFNDCNCPTFSKDGNLISKGFYWLVAPGLTMNKKTLELEELISSESQIAAHISLGAGLDIGIGDLFTVSPFISYTLAFGHEWPELSGITGFEGTTIDPDTNLSQFNIGLRAMFRPDYIKQNRGFRR